MSCLDVLLPSGLPIVAAKGRDRPDVVVSVLWASPPPSPLMSISGITNQRAAALCRSHGFLLLVAEASASRRMMWCWSS